MVSSPKYLTGDKAAINEFIDKFDVRHFHPKHTGIRDLQFPIDIFIRLRWWVQGENQYRKEPQLT